MRFRYFILVSLLMGPVAAFCQADSSFSIFVNSNIAFTRTNEPHINKWLTRYGYKPERPAPANLQLEVAAMPALSEMLYSLRLSALLSGENLFSVNLMAGAYHTLIHSRTFLLFAGVAVGRRSERIRLDGDMPPDYLVLAEQYHKQLSLDRNGFVIEPALRSFWFPVRIHNIQLGLLTELGYDIDANSRWKLGYYKQASSMYSGFKKIKTPADQQKAAAFGLTLNAGISARIRLR